ncbi:MAG TPA: methylenetetrahydrofolate--tRNA-(uracil(54)-C(5))-methyltransferase (FADH(2)-oxidizing) TrmFO, partial [Myxococcales bacterium]|nr:methylenetetrahydrofolate--tRNA-(uracil(54)-C(5))-methyltransferase (FADH(2)-oxidizing) TrmFO [Myxococcales bacterium]
MPARITLIGGGLAGSEAALLLAAAGVQVRLVEQKPVKRSPAHKTDGLAELVCSNSLRSDNPENAIGLLHEELRRLGSPVLEEADRARVPAGDALAVDRVRFSSALTHRIAEHPLIDVIAEEAQELPAGPDPCIVATGPLTGESLARSLAEAVGSSALAFYDALAPIVAADSIDASVAYAKSRYGKGSGDDYLNLPLSREEYERFVDELVRGEKVAAHAFEEPRYFEGCLPIEVMAARGREVLAHGPMKPVGLEHPETGKRPWAVVQLRREDRAGTAFNLVGFQTRLTWPEQKRIFASCIPGLANAQWIRLGQVHRNTFLDAPRALAGDGTLKTRPHVYCAGQITGVEGYVESAASGHIAARRVIARLVGAELRIPPGTTAIGALLRHVSGEAHPDGYQYQPSNVVFALFPALDGRHRKNERKARMVARAREDLAAWAASVGAPLRPLAPPPEAVTAAGEPSPPVRTLL